MGKTIASSERFEEMADTIEAHLFPQTCQLLPPKREITASGNRKEGLGDPIVWRGKTHIPCRLDTSRHYRQGEVFGQELTLSEFELNVPFDVPLIADYTVQLNGERYEIRKLMTGKGFETFRTALLSRIDTGAG